MKATTTPETVTLFDVPRNFGFFVVLLTIFTIKLHVTQLEKLPEKKEKFGLDGAFRILCFGCWRINSRYVKGTGFA